jgi:uncharacterized RDD family membrane protein YckC
MSDFPPPPPPPPGGQPPPPGGQPPFQQGTPPGYQQYGYGYGVGGPHDYAGFWIRFAAAVIDAIILGVPVAILGAALDSGGGFGYSIGYSPAYDPLLNLINTVVAVVYYGFLEGGPSGQTLGKRVCGIRVVDAETAQPGIGVPRGIGRYFARILSSIPLGLGYFWMLWDPKKQTWHDKLVRTIVVKA